MGVVGSKKKLKVAVLLAGETEIVDVGLKAGGVVYIGLFVGREVVVCNDLISRIHII